MKAVKEFIRSPYLGLVAVLIGLVVALIVCMRSSYDTNEERVQNANCYASNIVTVEIDSCEYLAYPGYGHNFGYTHKGNCKNPIHKK